MLLFRFDIERLSFYLFGALARYVGITNRNRLIWVIFLTWHILCIQHWIWHLHTNRYLFTIIVTAFIIATFYCPFYDRFVAVAVLYILKALICCVKGISEGIFLARHIFRFQRLLKSVYLAIKTLRYKNAVVWQVFMMLHLNISWDLQIFNALLLFKLFFSLFRVLYSVAYLGRLDIFHHYCLILKEMRNPSLFNNIFFLYNIKFFLQLRNWATNWGLFKLRLVPHLFWSPLRIILMRLVMIR